MYRFRNNISVTKPVGRVIKMNIPIQDKWLRDDTWQRVVDNELTPAELDELVEACEQNPKLWKCCAVAFLQEQAFQSELKRVVTQWNRDSGPTVSSFNELSKPHSQTAFAQPGSGHLQQRGTSQNSSLLNSLALAASLLLVFLVGWQTSKRFRAPVAPVAEHVAAAPVTGLKGQPQSDDRIIARQLPGGTNDSGVLETSPVSAFDSGDMAAPLEEFNQFVLVDKGMPTQLAELQQQGLVRIETTEGYVPVQLIDGNTAVVPIQQLDVRSVRHTY